MKNKKRNLLCGIVFSLTFLFGFILVYNLVAKKEEKLIEITVPILESKIENKDTFVLVISQTGCSHCQQYLPELEKTLKEVNLNAFVLNVSNITSEEGTTLNKYVNFSGTPTTLFFTNGVETTSLNRIVGYASKTKIKERLKSLGYID